MATKRAQAKHPVNKLELPPLVAERITCALSQWTGEIGRCHWCNEVITGKRRRTWCSDACGRAWQREHIWRFARSAAKRRACGRAWQREHIWRFARSAAKRRAKYRCTKPGCTAERRDCEVNHIQALNGLGYGPGCHHHSKADAHGGGLEVLCRAHHAEITAAQATARAAARREAKEAAKETTL